MTVKKKNFANKKIVKKKPAKKTPAKKKPAKKKPAKKKPNKKLPKRESNGYWKKGESGNPAGKPKGALSISDSLRHMMDATHIDITIYTEKMDGEQSIRHIKINTTNEQDMKTAIASSLLVEALNGNVRAAQEIYDRIDGKPAQKVTNVIEGLEVIVDNEVE